MNRTIKDATVKVFHYHDLESLKAHVLAFVTAYNFAKHLKRSDGEPPSRPSATPGQRTRHPSRSTRATSSRDHTARGCGHARGGRHPPRSGRDRS